MEFRTFRDRRAARDHAAEDRGRARLFLRDLPAEQLCGAGPGDVEFVQDNQSLSVRAGTIRGLHFQTHPLAQGKLVRCLAGTAVRCRGRPALRIRRPTAAGFRSILTPEENNQLWVPVGFGHGFCTLEPNSIISYRVTRLLQPASMTRASPGTIPTSASTGPRSPTRTRFPPRIAQQPRLAELPAYFSMEDS